MSTARDAHNIIHRLNSVITFSSPNHIKILKQLFFFEWKNTGPSFTNIIVVLGQEIQNFRHSNDKWKARIKAKKGWMENLVIELPILGITSEMPLRIPFSFHWPFFTISTENMKCYSGHWNVLVIFLHSLCWIQWRILLDLNHICKL